MEPAPHFPIACERFVAAVGENLRDREQQQQLGQREKAKLLACPSLVWKGARIENTSQIYAVSDFTQALACTADLPGKSEAGCPGGVKIRSQEITKASDSKENLKRCSLSWHLGRAGV